jgi:hypothetical protein
MLQEQNKNAKSMSLSFVTFPSLLSYSFLVCKISESMLQEETRNAKSMSLTFVTFPSLLSFSLLVCSGTVIWYIICKDEFPIFEEKEILARFLKACFKKKQEMQNL